MHILKEVSYMTISFPAIHFFYDSVIFSRERLKRSICQGHCVYFTRLVATIHYDKWSVVDSRKIGEYVSFGKTIVDCSFKGTYLFHRTSCNIFFFKKKCCVKCLNALTGIPFFHGECVKQFHNSDWKY